MDMSPLDKAKLRLVALEREADELRAFIRKYTELTQLSPPFSGVVIVSEGRFDGITLGNQKGELSSNEEIVSAARETLRSVHPRPLLIGDLFQALMDRGIKIGGRNPKGNLSAKLAPPKDIVYVKNEGWYYRPEREEASDTESGQDQSEASHSSNPAEGRKAGPGGGP